VTRIFEDDICRLLSVNLEVFWPRLPIYVVWVCGLILASKRRHRHSSISLITFGVLTVFLLDSLGGTFLGTVFAVGISEWGWSRDSTEALARGIEVVENFLTAALWGLVLVAIFGERQGQPGQPKKTAQPGAATDQPRDERFFEL
jgi:hypothetical protein